MEGKLYLVATPIGNLEDITLRALKILKEADIIAAEDTRHTIKLLNHFEIKTPMTSYHEHNKIEKARLLVDKLKQGATVALVTDAGTPGISDPGEELVRQCIAAGVEVTSAPGPAACVSALIISGKSTRRFAFEAFLPSEKKERTAVLEELKRETRTMVIYEAPHHLPDTLRDLSDALGEERKLSVCKELTKKHEKMTLFTLGEAVAYYEAHAPRGEYVLVIEGKERALLEKEAQSRWHSLTEAEHVAYYEAQGIERKEAMKKAAKDRGVSRRDIYQALLAEEK